MGKIIVVVGNSGVGKTTLTHLLSQQGKFAAGLEQIGERPFQKLFANDLYHFALPNQIDFLLFRAEQELAIRKSPEAGILDGGLDEDFFIFTRHFYQKGYLRESEFRLCERLIMDLRQLLPPPELIISLEAPLEIIAARFARRGRQIEIAQRTDLDQIQHLLDEFLNQQAESRLLHVDGSADDPTYAALLPTLLKTIQSRLFQDETS